MAKLFIVDYTHSSGSGTRVIRAKSHSSFKDRLWMCHSARITEVKPTRAWRWNNRKFEAVSPRVDLIIEEHEIATHMKTHMKSAEKKKEESH